MLFRSYIPCAPLRDFVEDFWLYDGYAGGHAFEKILPSGTFEMVFNLGEDQLRIYDAIDVSRCRTFAGALVSGPYAESFMSDTQEEASIMGVHFRPGGAVAILGLPAGELAGAHADLRTIWGPSATVLREQLCSLSRPSERFRLLECALLERLADTACRHRAVRTALDVLIRAPGRARVRDLARSVDLSQRRFIEVFTAEVGLTPKLFGRIQRFQQAVALSQDATRADWAQIALECGYFDQSHLIREFIEFSGAAPSDYLRRQNRLDAAGVHVKRYHLPLAE